MGGRGALRIASLLLVPLLLAGCINREQEQLIGRQIAAQMNAQLPLVHDVPLNLYVNDLGRLIARHSERPDLDYQFYIVDSNDLNAFALPGGHIYVNRGLIERTRNVSELAGVLAHEIGHVAARHGARSLERHLRTGSVARTMWQLILGREPLLDQEALELGGAFWAAQHSREAEAEADELAVEYLLEAGVDPRGMLSLFTALLHEEEQMGGPAGAAPISWLATHPATRARLRATRRAIRRALPEPEPALLTDNPSYPDFLQRLRTLPPPAYQVVIP